LVGKVDRKRLPIRETEIHDTTNYLYAEHFTRKLPGEKQIEILGFVCVFVLFILFAHTLHRLERLPQQSLLLLAALDIYYVTITKTLK
jgi:hypothetical protein